MQASSNTASEGCMDSKLCMHVGWMCVGSRRWLTGARRGDEGVSGVCENGSVVPDDSYGTFVRRALDSECHDHVSVERVLYKRERICGDRVHRRRELLVNVGVLHISLGGLAL